MTKSLESLRLAEAFFAERPELLATVRAFLTEAWERWPETEVVTQKSQVTLRGPRPFCALSTHIRFPRMPGPCYVTLSLFLPPIPAGSARRHGSGTISRPLGQPSAPVSPGGPGHAALGVGGGGPSLSEYQDLRPVCLIWCLRRYFLPLASRLHKGPPDAISVRRPS